MVYGWSIVLLAMATKRTPVWIDCDNTFGLPGQEIDDGLTILYLLAHPAVEVVGISAAHGNGAIEQVVPATRALLERISSDLTIAAGASPPAGDEDVPGWRSDSAAARSLVEASHRYTGELVVLGLGALSNLAGAIELDAQFVQRVASIKVMGGYLAPIRFRSEVHELNFSADPAGAHTVLHAGTDVTIMSAQLCLAARFGVPELRSLNRGPMWLRSTVRKWARTFGRVEGRRGFYLWDLLPAVAIVEPDRFPRRIVRLASNEEDLTYGSLRLEPVENPRNPEPRTPGIVDIPTSINREDSFVRDCAQGWVAGAAGR